MHGDLPDKKITYKQSNDLLAMLKKYDGACIVEDPITHICENTTVTDTDEYT